MQIEQHAAAVEVFHYSNEILMKFIYAVFGIGIINSPPLIAPLLPGPHFASLIDGALSITVAPREDVSDHAGFYWLVS